MGGIGGGGKGEGEEGGVGRGKGEGARQCSSAPRHVTSRQKPMQLHLTSRSHRRFSAMHSNNGSSVIDMDTTNDINLNPFRFIHQRLLLDHSLQEDFCCTISFKNPIAEPSHLRILQL